MGGEAAAQIASDRGGLSVEVSHGLCEPPHRSALFQTGSGPAFGDPMRLGFLRAGSEGEISSLVGFIDPDSS